MELDNFLLLNCIGSIINNLSNTFINEILVFLNNLELNIYLIEIYLNIFLNYKLNLINDFFILLIDSIFNNEDQYLQISSLKSIGKLVRLYYNEFEIYFNKELIQNFFKLINKNSTYYLDNYISSLSFSILCNFFTYYIVYFEIFYFDIWNSFEILLINHNIETVLLQCRSLILLTNNLNHYPQLINEINHWNDFIINNFKEEIIISESIGSLIEIVRILGYKFINSNIIFNFFQKNYYSSDILYNMCLLIKECINDLKENSFETFFSILDPLNIYLRSKIKINEEFSIQIFGQFFENIIPNKLIDFFSPIILFILNYLINNNNYLAAYTLEQLSKKNFNFLKNYIIELENYLLLIYNSNNYLLLDNLIGFFCQIGINIDLNIEIINLIINYIPSKIDHSEDKIMLKFFLKYINFENFQNFQNLILKFLNSSNCSKKLLLKLKKYII